MANEELLGGAFFEIGGKTGKLKEALDSSFRMTQDSLARMADMAKQFGDEAGEGFGWAAKAMTGPGGMAAALAEMLSSLINIEQVTARLRQSLALHGQDVGGVQGIIGQLGQQARGTPYTSRQLEARALDMLNLGVEPAGLGTAMELAIGAAYKLNTSLADAATRVAGVWSGVSPTALLLPVHPGTRTREERMIAMENVYGPQARSARAMYRDPLTGGIQEKMARIGDVIRTSLHTFLRDMLGGYSPEQQVLIAQQAAVQQTGLGPTARGRGITQLGMLQPGMQQANMMEVAQIMAQQVGDPSRGKLGDLSDVFSGLTDYASELLDAFKELANWLRELPTTIRMVVEQWILELQKSLPNMLSGDLGFSLGPTAAGGSRASHPALRGMENWKPGDPPHEFTFDPLGTGRMLKGALEAGTSAWDTYTEGNAPGDTSDVADKFNDAVDRFGEFISNVGATPRMGPVYSLGPA